MKKMRKVAGMLMAATVAMAMPMSAMAAYGRKSCERCYI